MATFGEVMEAAQCFRDAVERHQQASLARLEQLHACLRREVEAGGGDLVAGEPLFQAPAYWRHFELTLPGASRETVSVPVGVQALPGEAFNLHVFEVSPRKFSEVRGACAYIFDLIVAGYLSCVQQQVGVENLHGEQEGAVSVLEGSDLRGG